MSNITLPAAWYPDPDDAARLRWWDGGAWTEHVQVLLPPPPPAPAFLAAPAEPDPFIIKTRVPETGTWYAETGNLHVPRAPSDEPQPAAVRTTTPPTEEDAVAGSTWTVEIWVMALLPLVAFGVQYFLWTVGDPNGSIFTDNPAFFWIIPVLVVVAGPVLATMDRNALRARRITDSPSPLLGLVPPIYFLVRAVNIGAASVATLILWAVLAVGLYTPWKYLIEWMLAIVAQAPPV